MDVRELTAHLSVEHEDVDSQWEEITICASQWDKRSQSVPANERSLLMTVSYLNYGAQMDVRVVTTLLSVEHEDVASQWEEITICARQWDKRSQSMPANERSLLMTVSYLNYGAQMDVRGVAALLCIEHEDVANQWEEITICASQLEELIDDS